MNINEILTSLRAINSENIDIRLYFTRKRSNGRYNSYSPSISKELQIDLKNIVIDALDKIRDSEQRPFNPIGAIEGCIENCNINGVSNFQEIIESMDEDTVDRRIIPESEVGKLNFYILKICIENQNDILIFRRVTKFNRLSKGIIGRVVAGDFEKLQPNLLGIDSSVDVIVYQQEMLILNHIALERIFSIQDQYVNKATQTLEIVGRTNKIRNFEQFREDCLSDGRIIRALTKILNEEDRISQCFENFENVINVVDIFDLDIEFEDGNTVLVYEEKSQLLDITRLIRDSFYRTLITNREGIDEGV